MDGPGTRAERDLERSAFGRTAHRPEPAVLADFWEAFGDTVRLHDVAVWGISTMASDALTLERRKLGPTEEHEPSSSSAERSLQAAMERQQLAEHQRARDFETLNGLCLVGIWGALEALVEGVARSAYEYLPTAWARFVLERAPVPEQLKDEHPNAAAEIEIALREEFVDGRQRHKNLRLPSNPFDVAAGLRGLERLEKVLDRVGLGGAIDEEAHRALVEASELRHVVAHRSGRIDDRFLERCPWLGYELGDLARVTRSDFARYRDVIREQAMELQRRLLAWGGVALAEPITGIEEPVSERDRTSWLRPLAALLREERLRSAMEAQDGPRA